MRAGDIVMQLAAKLPSFVDDFTKNDDVSALTRVGTTVSVTTTAPHGLTVGKAVNVVGAKTPITASSITRSGVIATLTTDADHDMTKSGGFDDVEIEGATEAEFNGTFPLLGVENRRVLTFQVPDSGPISATGSPLLINGSSIFKTYNGLRAVSSVPSTTVYEYEVTDSTLFTPASGVIKTKKFPRISAAVSYERILQAYTKEVPDDVWLFVVMGDSQAQKNRRIDVDSTDNVQKVHYFNQRITQVATLYLIVPTTAQIAARQARDRAEELLRPICRSILLAKFDTLLDCDFNNPLQFNEHGFHDYNSAYYVHRYTFEATLQMTFEDTVGPDDDVAFRDISMTMNLDVGTEPMLTDLDLDDNPL